jgi:hypothetical protein
MNIINETPSCLCDAVIGLYLIRHELRAGSLLGLQHENTFWTTDRLRKGGWPNYIGGI